MSTPTQKSASTTMQQEGQQAIPLNSSARTNLNDERVVAECLAAFNAAGHCLYPPTPQRPADPHQVTVQPKLVEAFLSNALKASAASTFLSHTNDAATRQRAALSPTSTPPPFGAKHIDPRAVVYEDIERVNAKDETALKNDSIGRYSNSSSGSGSSGSSVGSKLYQYRFDPYQQQHQEQEASIVQQHYVPNAAMVAPRADVDGGRCFPARELAYHGAGRVALLSMAMGSRSLPHYFAPADESRATELTPERQQLRSFLAAAGATHRLEHPQLRAELNQFVWYVGQLPGEAAASVEGHCRVADLVFHVTRVRPRAVTGWRKDGAENYAFRMYFWSFEDMATAAVLMYHRVHLARQVTGVVSSTETGGSVPRQAPFPAFSFEYIAIVYLYPGAAPGDGWKLQSDIALFGHDAVRYLAREPEKTLRLEPIRSSTLGHQRQLRHEGYAAPHGPPPQELYFPPPTSQDQAW